MNVLTIIPARGGSKRLPGKNLKPLLGRPLIWWTMQTAREAGLNPVFVSTDSEEIAQQSIWPVIRRPAELAQDDTPTLPVIRHALERAEDTLDLKIYPWVLILQPTSPLRHSGDIQNAIAMADSTSVSSVVSVARTTPLKGSEERGGATFHTNGAIYLINRHTLLRGELYGPNPRLYLMPPERSIDIDYEDDFRRAEQAMHEKEVVEWGV